LAGASALANGFLIRIDASGNLLESTWLNWNSAARPSGFSVTTSSASALFVIQSEVDVVTLAPQTTPSTVNLACIGNSATLTGGLLAPGEIVSLFGSGIGPPVPGVAQFNSTSGRFPTSVANTRVTFDGVAAPLLYVSNTQINAIAPFGLTPGNTSQVCVTYEGTTKNCIAATVAAASPGIFQNPSALGYAVALNQNGTLNTSANPAHGGDIITMFATGLGELSSQPADGSLVQLPLPAQSMNIQVQAPDPNGAGRQIIFATVEYAGPAPLEVAGLSQLNVQLPTYMGAFNGPLIIWVTLPDGTVVQSPPIRIFVAFS
jgi:uncharacterized protein (TIGR03437 family)